MAKKSDLLQDAIADAKAVREMALENAKEALKEAFTPKLQSMLSQKIQQEMDEEYDAEKSNDPADLNQFPQKGDGEQTPDFKEEKELDEAADLKSSDIGKGDNKEPTQAAHGDVNTTDDKEGNTFGSPAQEDEDLKPEDSKYGMEEGVEAENTELDEELDLESIIRELEEGDYMDDEFMDDGEEDDMGDAGEVAIDAGGDEGGEDSGDMEGDIELDIDLDDDDEVNMEGTQIEERREGYEDGYEEKMKDLDEALATIKSAETIKALEAKISELEGQLAEANGAVDEYREGVKYLRDKLNEVNVLNAKLLFTNKLFRNFNLDQKAKVRVIENFDRAANIREIKLVFTTLAENLKLAQSTSTTKKSTEAVKRITEGASKVVESTKPKDENIIQESAADASVLRTQKLAGIIK